MIDEKRNRVERKSTRTGVVAVEQEERQYPFLHAVEDSVRQLNEILKLRKETIACEDLMEDEAPFAEPLWSTDEALHQHCQQLLSVGSLEVTECLEHSSPRQEV